MSQIIPNPNARQIRQALEQGLRGIAKTISAMSAAFEVFAQPLVSKFGIFGPATVSMSIKTPTPETAVFTAGTPVVQITNDALKTASFVTVGAASIVPDSGSYDLTIEAIIDAGEGGSFTTFETFDEELLLDVPFTITGASQTNPVTITTGAAHGYSNGDQVYIEGIVGMIALNRRIFTITNASGSVFDLVGEDGTGYPAWTSGGLVYKIIP